MKRVLTLLLPGLVAFGVSLLATLPAAQFYAWFGDRFEAVQAYGLRGKLVAGSADRLTWKGVTINGLRWSLHPSSLLRGRLALRVEFRDPRSEARGKALVGITPGGALHLSRTRLHLPMAALLQLWPEAPLALGGMLRLDLKQLVLDAGHIRAARGRLDWRQARLTGASPVPFGDLGLALAPDGDRYKGLLTDQGGPLRVAGLLTLEADGAYRFHADLAVADPAQRRLATALRLIGPAGADGKVRIDFDGRLPLPGRDPVTDAARPAGG